MSASPPVTLDTFLRQLRERPELVEFDATLALIDALYRFTPVAFCNGTLCNAAGRNTGSCKLLAFARLHGLTGQETLACFGHHYRDAVRLHPDGDNHPNIRNFMASGWAGVEFEADPLRPRPPR